jgi:hypothetical protein
MPLGRAAWQSFPERCAARFTALAIPVPNSAMNKAGSNNGRGWEE